MYRRHKVALVGDYDATKTAHICAPQALQIAATALQVNIDGVWLETFGVDALTQSQIEELSGIWCLPGSPYKNRAGVLRLIEYARRSKTPFLGTCGGCQHAVLEYAINELAIQNAGLEEEDPNVETPIISALPCRLTNESQKITLVPDSKIGRAFNSTEIREEYFCGFGINPKFLPLFSNSSLRFVGFNDEMIPQAIELENHPFFVGTAFQPERSAPSGRVHPLIAAFVNAIVSDRE